MPNPKKFQKYLDKYTYTILNFTLAFASFINMIYFVLYIKTMFPVFCFPTTDHYFRFS